MKLLRNQEGQGMTEYIIIVALIAIAAIAAFTYFGKTVRTQTAVMTESLAGADGKAASESKLSGIVTSAGTEADTTKGLQNYTDSNKAQ